MSVMLVLEVPGASTEDYDRVNELAGVSGNVPEGLIHHACAVTPDGLLVADVWESQEAIDRFFSERLGAALAQVGLEGTPRILPVHNRIDGA
jgi:hypothetical protein